MVLLSGPNLSGNELKYVKDCIDTGWVSSVGSYVSDLEKSVSNYIGSKYAVAMSSGTTALHLSLEILNICKDDYVIAPNLTFIATLNAIKYTQATPILLDVDEKSWQIDLDLLEKFLDTKTNQVGSDCVLKEDGKIIKAIVSVHVLGNMCDMSRLKEICETYNIILVEDAAESLGSKYNHKHSGTFGKIGCFSFNGNKIITTGGGGMLLTNDKILAEKAKHITTTSKVKHKWAFEHDEVGYNYRLPNLNAALGLAQMELLPKILKSKRIISEKYSYWGKKNGIEFIKDKNYTKSNFWLNTALTNSLSERNKMLESTNKNGVTTRPVWTPMHKMTIYQKFKKIDLSNTEWLYDRLVNVPSSPIL